MIYLGANSYGLGLPIDVQRAPPAPEPEGVIGGFCGEVRAIYATITPGMRAYVDRLPRERLLRALMPVTGFSVFYSAQGAVYPAFKSAVDKLGSASVADCLISMRPTMTKRGRMAGIGQDELAATTWCPPGYPVQCSYASPLFQCCKDTCGIYNTECKKFRRVTCADGTKVPCAEGLPDSACCPDGGGGGGGGGGGTGTGTKVAVGVAVLGIAAFLLLRKR